VIIVSTALLIFFSSFALLGTGALKVSFFPEAEPASLIVNIDMPGGSSLEKTSKTVKKVEEILMSSKNIKLFNTVIGGSEIDFATISAEFVDKKNMTMDGFKFVEEINDEFSKIPGAKITIQNVVAGPPTARPIEIEILGDDLEGAKKLAREYENKLKQIPGVYNSEISLSGGGPELYIDINKPKAQSLGFSTSTIGFQLRNLIEGTTATTAKIDNENIDVILKIDEEKINDIRKIENLILQTQSGENIPLSHIAKVKKLEGVSSIKHEDEVRILTLESDLKQGYNVNDVITEFRSSVEDIEIPKSLDVIYAGDVEDIQENFGYLFQSMIIAVFLVFIILTVQFNSLAQPFVILMTVPMSLIGVLYGLLITGNSFGFYAFIGIVALVGIAVNDAIVLIDYMNYLRREGKGLNEAIVEAGITRFNPVIATTLTTIGGVLPLAFKDAYYEQFSYTLIFGLLVTTILTLVIIPIGYSAIEGVKAKFTKKNFRKEKYKEVGESFE
jgi:HAE1 family hydrophobic/amphiphilic exporter-1